MFLTAQELQVIQNDYDTLLQSTESSRVTIEYRTWYSPGMEPDMHPIYKNDQRTVDSVPVTLEDVHCIQHIIKKDWELGKYSQFLVEVGDCIFHFHKSQNLQEPVAGKEVVPHSMIFIDQSMVRWKPKQYDAGPLSKNILFRIGEGPIGQPVACRIEK